jgi:tetratricopeptide (TPR) repeat protein
MRSTATRDVKIPCPTGDQPVPHGASSCAGTGLDPPRASRTGPGGNGWDEEPPSAKISRRGRRVAAEPKPGDETEFRTTLREPPPLPAAAAPAAALPDRIGRYVVERELGRGGMGIVYRARDPELNRPVALKVVLDPARATPDALARFRLEATAAARLRHPGIVTVYEVSEHEGKPFIALELVEGESLERLLLRASMPPRRLAELVREVALALDHAHGQGVVHRDVKPENVLVDAEGRARLTDFGLARDAARPEGITATGTILGTPAYMAPEQAAGETRAQGPATDVYALGAVLYRGLVGRPPFAAPALAALIHRILHDEPVAPHELRKDVHADLETIVLRCLEKEPGRRVPSAAELARELEHYLAGEPIRSRPIGSLERVQRWTRRNRLATALGLLLVLSVAGAAVALALGSRRATQRSEEAKREERRAFVARARAEAERATAAFAAARGASHGTFGEDEAGRRGADALLARGLDALEATAQLAALVPDDAAAKDAARSAAVDLGDAALATRQWSVAASAYEKARAFGGVGAALEERLERERSRVLAEHAAKVLGILEDARSGKLALRPDGRDDALFALAGLAEGQTVAIVGSALDGVTAELEAVERGLLLSASEPSPDEARNGEQPIEGLARAVAAWLARDPGGDEEPPPAVRDARRRLERRRGRERSQEVVVPSYRAILVADQGRLLATGHAALARLACQALGRLGIREGATGPLARYLRAQNDQLLAADAGIALCQLGGREAVDVLVATCERMGVTSAFSKRIMPRLRAVEGARSGREAEARARDLPREAFRSSCLGEDAKAVALLTSAIALHPEDPALLASRGEARFRIGDADGAALDETRALELRPDMQRALELRGRVRVMKGDFDAAIADETSAIACDASVASPFGARAIARRWKEDFAGAIVDATHGVELDPENEECFAIRASARKLKGDLDGAIEDATRAIFLDATYAIAWYVRGSARRDKGDLEGARADFTRAIELDPRNADVTRDRAYLRERLGDFPGAIADFTRVVELRPRDAAACADRGGAKELGGDRAGAFEDYARAIELDARCAAAWANRGLLRGAAGDLKAAIEDLTHAIELDPQAKIWNDRGALRAQMGDTRGALSDFKRAIKKDPAYAEAFVNKAQALGLQGDAEGAIADATHAIELKPDLVMAWLVRGENRFEDGDVDGCIADLTRATELDPSSAVAWSKRGYARQTRHDLDAALSDYSRAIEVDPRFATAWRHRGAIRLARGDREAALSDFERYLELAPEDSFAPTIKKAVAKLKAGK